MMKFASFETIVELLYKYAIPTPKDQCSKSFQLGVSFAGGYVAGVFCAIVSHPADNLVSFLNNAQGATVGDVSELYQSLFVCNCLFLLIVACVVWHNSRVALVKKRKMKEKRVKPIPLLQAVKKLGLWGLFTRGLPLRIVMIGTLTGAQWGIYDAFKVFVGL